MISKPKVKTRITLWIQMANNILGVKELLCQNRLEEQTRIQMCLPSS